VMLRMHLGRAHTGLWLRRLLQSTACVHAACASPRGTVPSALVRAAQQVAGKHGATSPTQCGSGHRLQQRARRSSSTAAGEGGSISVRMGIECSEDGSSEAQRASNDAQGSAEALPSKGRLDPGLYLVATPIGESKTLCMPHHRPYESCTTKQDTVRRLAL